MMAMKEIGMSCAHVSRLVSDATDRPLTMGERLKVRMHTAMCRYCSRFAEQLALLRCAIEQDKRGD